MNKLAPSPITETSFNVNLLPPEESLFKKDSDHPYISLIGALRKR
jgi:hypothetical protein